MPAAEHSPTKRPSRPHGTGASCTTAMHRPACRCRWVSTFHRRNCSVFKRSRHCSALVSVGHGPILGVRHDNSNSRPGLRKSVHSATRSLHRWKQVIAKAGHQGRWPPQPAGKEGGPHSRPARKVLPRHSPLSSAYRPRRMHRHFPELATKAGGLHSRPPRQVACTAGHQGRWPAQPATKAGGLHSRPPRQVASTAGHQGRWPPKPAAKARAPPHSPLELRPPATEDAPTLSGGGEAALGFGRLGFRSPRARDRPPSRDPRPATREQPRAQDQPWARDRPVPPLATTPFQARHRPGQGWTPARDDRPLSPPGSPVAPDHATPHRRRPTPGQRQPARRAPAARARGAPGDTSPSRG